jgi:hypothetical protein
LLWAGSAASVGGQVAADDYDPDDLTAIRIGMVIILFGPRTESTRRWLASASETAHLGFGWPAVRWLWGIETAMGKGG